MKRKINRVNWLIGGAQGSGVDSAANMFARACASGGLHVYGQREYYSNIMGEHSYYQVRIADRPTAASSDQTDLLVTFDAETVFLHAQNVVPQGGVIYDPKLVETPLDRIPAMENRVREDIKKYLAEQSVGETMGDLLSIASNRGVRLFAVPYDDLIQKLSEKLGEPVSKLKKAANTMAVAASCALLGYGVEWLEKALTDVFKGKKKVVDINVRASELVYEHMAHSYEDGFFCELKPIPTKEKRVILTGNQAVALGKIIAGCSFQTYYPISPATDESTYLEAHAIFSVHGESKQGAILVVQCEDEISAINMATGAALTGARASTATSGPGFSLMVEGLGLAAIDEIPLVVTLYQRGSPSTGLPTRTEQGDLRFALHAGHGEAPRIVVASGDLEEAFHDTIRAFNWAEKYQMPVIHLLDKAIASSSQTYPAFQTRSLVIERGQLLSESDVESLSGNGSLRTFQFSETGISPRVALGTRGGVSWRTSDEHDEWGHITEDPVTRVKMMDKRMAKLETLAREIPVEEKLNVLGDPKAKTVVLSWGSTKGAILEAIDLLKTEGISVKFIQARLIWPLPAEEIAKHLLSAQRVIAIENNYSGQLAGLVRQYTGVNVHHLIVKYNGRPMSVDEIHGAIQQIVSGEAPAKVVLTHGT
ncbi:MAG: 2-oxoglutarate ferredoxin oxidoreductase subunit alpha [Candidatus Fraserbacteria bacterium RBG_16_55_9]|uniref:2-oxoglutarate ferredoxin oxidoreductase subunit alpha n=1 Tax=Fraserbacteria sp. (strain RBG_16_55_9) TaxID=1817864 RepID=A0A1F5UPP7_FRAXR|nr:MAG: 2-oxoglutarate ferredoxin oxidoreductase subunit alpha [Candidatus Fraserbacteria bacterium RBG_16_55_9]